MDIKNILDSLGLDLSDAEAKQGALEAIQAILASREPPASLGNSSGAGQGNSMSEPEEVELDPELIQPSQKYNINANDIDLDIEDEDNVLGQMQQNSPDILDDHDSDDFDGEDIDEAEPETAENESNNATDKGTESDGTKSDTEEDENSINNSAPTDDSAAKSDLEDSDEKDLEDEDFEGEVEENNDSEGSEETEDEGFIDDEDLVDDDLQDIYKDAEIKSKQNSRKIKRERALSAAKKALDDARAKKVAPALLKELEASIEALEGLQEAVKKSLKDISDEEFNLILNRVFDAIAAVGDTSLTYKTEAERELQVKEIKDDLANVETQRELSAEDIAKIRAETQQIKAREKENDKYKKRSNDSFKGFQEFLNSLYRAIALQVQTNEVNNDTWSAINRRYSGTNVLKQGQRKEELPDKKIPIIDFYFDCSGSWEDSDIAIGQKAVSKLANMEANGQIKINVYYFANHVHNDISSARAEGGTRAWNDIVKNVISTNATNVIIMTDSDMEDWWEGKTALSYTVPGYVWYLWRDGDNAPRLPRDLKGRGGTQQFSFTASNL